MQFIYSYLGSHLSPILPLQKYSLLNTLITFE